MATTVYLPDSESEITVLPWEEWKEMFASSYRQGEHISAVGPTGSGKSTALFEVAQIVASRKAKNNRPASVVVLGTKPRDDTLTALHKKGWPIVKVWPPGYGNEHCIVWPRNAKWGASQMTAHQKQIFGPLLDKIFVEGGQSVVIDETADFSDPFPEGLGMKATLSKFWRDARSNKVSVIAGTQRPRNVPLLMWSEPSWLIAFRIDDEDDLKRVAQLSGFKQAFWEAAQDLGEFEFICVRRQKKGQRGLYVSRVESKTHKTRKTGRK